MKYLTACLFAFLLTLTACYSPDVWVEDEQGRHLIPCTAFRAGMIMNYKLSYVDNISKMGVMTDEEIARRAELTGVPYTWFKSYCDAAKRCYRGVVIEWFSTFWHLSVWNLIVIRNFMAVALLIGVLGYFIIRPLLPAAYR